MCGIVAIYRPNGGVSAEALERATALLHHRVPTDAAGSGSRRMGGWDWATPGSASSIW